MKLTIFCCFITTLIVGCFVSLIGNIFKLFSNSEF